MKKRYFTILTFAVTGAALYLAFRQTNIRMMIEYLAKGRYVYVIPAFVGLMLYAYLRALRWGHFFDKNIGTGLLFSTTMIGLMANSIFPARAGEFLKAYLLGKHSRISKSSCLATVVLERLWDGITLLVFIGCMFVWVALRGAGVLGDNSNVGLIRYAAYVSIAVYLCVFALILAWKFHAARTTAFIRSVISRFSVRIADYVADRLSAFNEGFSVFSDHKKIIAVSVYSILIWLSAIVTLFLMFKVFSFDLPFTAAFILVILIALFVMIPSIGSLGTMQLAFVLGLGIYGIDKNQALSFSILYQFFDTVPTVLIGLVFFLKDGISLGQVKAMKEEMT